MHWPDLERRIGITFQDKTLLKQALTHRSYLNEHRGEGLVHNERLEFLGDAVLELVTTEFLFRKYPNKEEGPLTFIRSALVNIYVLAGVAEAAGMKDFILMSRGEAKGELRAHQTIIGDAFEAVIGAIYLDQGYEAAKTFITAHILSKADEIVEKGDWRDPKSILQEKTQQKDLKLTPTYKLIEATGPDHAKRYVVGVFFGETLIAKGHGPSKRLAEEQAAKAALVLKGWTKSPLS